MAERTWRARRRWRRVGKASTDRWTELPVSVRAAATPEPEPELVGAGSAPRSVAPLTGANAPAEAVEGRGWVEPLDGGGCPAGHPVKVNDSSGIYHVPGGRFYDRTVAGRCYTSPEAAAADGYRPAKA